MESDRINRLVHTVYKLAHWANVDIGELIEEGYLLDEDLDAVEYEQLKTGRP